MKKPSRKAIQRQKNLQRSSNVRAPSRPLSRWIQPTGALLVGSLAGGSALAATINIDYSPADFDTLVVTVTGHETVGAPQLNEADITAQILNSVGDIDTDVGTGTDLTLDVTDNVFGALAAGNSFINEIDLNLINDGGAAGSAAARGGCCPRVLRQPRLRRFEQYHE